MHVQYIGIQYKHLIQYNIFIYNILFELTELES